MKRGVTTLKPGALLTLIALFGIVLAGCIQDLVSYYAASNEPITGPLTSPPSTGSPSVNNGTPPADNIAPNEPEVKEFSIIAKTWEFQPSTITVKRGDQVKLKITSVDVAHGINIPEFNVNSRLEPGQETVVEFTADKAGSFTFFCSVFCGSGHSGMRGTLVVTEN